ncbi:MAG TPA: metallophosphoesterase family protein, partial [Victivallales bacterium]|nr:metallophosphoesterase family protein [Victivallales bacterium]
HDWASVNLFSSRYFNHVASEAIHWTKNNIREEDKGFLESLKLIFKNEHLTMVHGTLNKPQDFDYITDGYIAEESFRILDTPLCFVAHSHTPGVFIKDKEDYIVYRQEELVKIEEGNRYIVNVGSVGQPRDGNPAACYCIYDTESQEVSIKRVVYNAQLVREKIIFAGLPRSLGDRLLMGV